ncbi:hypothetical protein D9M68_617240 [compost metagenome]
MTIEVLRYLKAVNFTRARWLRCTLLMSSGRMRASIISWASLGTMSAIASPGPTTAPGEVNFRSITSPLAGATTTCRCAASFDLRCSCSISPRRWVVALSWSLAAFT